MPGSSRLRLEFLSPARQQTTRTFEAFIPAEQPGIANQKFGRAIAGLDVIGVGRNSHEDSPDDETLVAVDLQTGLFAPAARLRARDGFYYLKC